MMLSRALISSSHLAEVLAWVFGLENWVKRNASRRGRFVSVFRGEWAKKRFQAAHIFLAAKLHFSVSEIRSIDVRLHVDLIPMDPFVGVSKESSRARPATGKTAAVGDTILVKTVLEAFGVEKIVLLPSRSFQDLWDVTHNGRPVSRFNPFVSVTVQIWFHPYRWVHCTRGIRKVYGAVKILATMDSQPVIPCFYLAAATPSSSMPGEPTASDCLRRAVKMMGGGTVSNGLVNIFICY
ncbi:hypothetical protein B0H17DRAFT_1138982 [Mycena rosella]|uniref:Uncharacterized protein n=1 Tax=Mycena rosella TaxID=1033263 RepID=A0AAD7D5H0_MYCRO|nr:hypothetical protein B0H17DRAFT_1138982 [Mycena rosella]